MGTVPQLSRNSPLTNNDDNRNNVWRIKKVWKHMGTRGPSKARQTFRVHGQHNNASKVLSSINLGSDLQGQLHRYQVAGFACNKPFWCSTQNKSFQGIKQLQWNIDPFFIPTRHMRRGCFTLDMVGLRLGEFATTWKILTSGSDPDKLLVRHQFRDQQVI